LRKISDTSTQLVLMAKAIAKANQNELDQYEKHYNTAYSVSK
jgi:hypothetical protein